LSGKYLDAKHFGFGVTAILGGAYTFLVCHNYLVSLFRQQKVTRSESVYTVGGGHA
jgi:hypothetical protein